MIGDGAGRVADVAALMQAEVGHSPTRAHSRALIRCGYLLAAPQDSSSRFFSDAHFQSVSATEFGVRMPFLRPDATTSSIPSYGRSLSYFRWLVQQAFADWRVDVVSAMLI